MASSINPDQMLGDKDIDYLDHILLELGNDDSILSVSALDGFLTALVSGPAAIVPSVWLPAVWGNQDPVWPSRSEFARFMQTVIRLMNYNASTLMNQPEMFEPLFAINTGAKGEVQVVDDWCFGYMRGVALGQWPALPADMQIHLDAIALHGLEENFEKLDTLSTEAHQATIPAIVEAVRQLHGYWLWQR